MYNLAGSSSLQDVYIRCFWWSDVATLRPALSVLPAYDQELVICNLLVGRDLISWYVTCLVFAIGETVA